MSDKNARTDQLKARLEQDFEIALEPFSVVVVCVIIFAIWEYVWDDAWVLLLLPLMWAIYWVASGGIARTLGALLRIPVNAVRLLLLTRKTHGPTH